MSSILLRLTISSIYYGAVGALLAAVLYSILAFGIFGYVDPLDLSSLAFVGFFFGVASYIIASPWV